jgi:hypothetical protein
MGGTQPAGTSEFTDAGWKRSAYCGPDGGNCVEVNGSAPDRTAVRDSKPRNARMLVFRNADWSRFLDGIGDLR